MSIKKFAIKFGIIFTIIIISMIIFLQFIGIQIVGNVVYVVILLSLFFSFVLYLYHKQRVVKSGHRYFIITMSIFILSTILFVGSLDFNFINPVNLEKVSTIKLWSIDVMPQRILIGMAFVTFILSVIVLKQMIVNAPRL